MVRKAGLIILAFGVLVFINSGCSLLGLKKKEWRPTAPRSMPLVHTVKYSGETLSIIAEWYTGDVNNWRALANANPQIYPNKLVAGDKVFIPENLLKTRKPLTDKYVHTYLKKNKSMKKPGSKTKTRPKKKEEFDLIGPK